MKLKITTLPVLLLSAILLTSCTASLPQSVTAVLEEAKELAVKEYGRAKEYLTEQYELFMLAAEDVPPLIGKKAYSTPGLVLLETLEADTPSVRTNLEKYRHTELLDTKYNSLSTLSSHAEGDREMLAVLPGKSMLTEAATSGYTLVKFESYTADSMTSALDSAGVKYELKAERNPSPAGTVFAISYLGLSDAVGFYIDPSEPVILYVSDEKTAKVTEKNEKNTVYITYDDGPTDENTIALLDILDSYGVKAAFFTTGTALKKNPEAAKAVLERGHTLGCHTVSHNYTSIYRSVDALTAEVREWESIAEAEGIYPTKRLFRFPGGSVGKYFTPKEADSMISALEGMGYTVFDWNVVSNDSILYMCPTDISPYDYIKGCFTDTLKRCIKDNKSKENAPVIILLHETVDETVQLMPWMLEYLISNGYTFGDLSTLEESWTFGDR